MFHFQGFATQRLLVFNAVNSSVTFSSSILSRILATNPLLCPHSAGAPSVVNPTSFSQGSPISFTHLDTYSYRSCPVVVPCIGRNAGNSSVMLRLESTPRTKIDSWAMSDVSVLSSTAREYAMKSFPFLTSCSFMLVESWSTRSATVFLLRLTFEELSFVWAHCVTNF